MAKSKQKMKIVFNSTRYLLALALALVVMGHSSESHAGQTYFTTKKVLAAFFPKSERISFKEFSPSASQRSALKKRLGYELGRDKYYFYVAMTGKQVDGYAFIDDQMGQHEPMTFAVKLSTEGVVLRQELMVYRETRGDEIRDHRFQEQFTGKTVHDSLRPNKDIDCVSGATISSRAITIGVRRALVLFDTAIVEAKALRVSQASN